LLDHLVLAAAADYIPDIESGAQDFTPLSKLSTTETLKSQIGTSEWLREIAEEDEAKLNAAQQQKVAETFQALVTQDPTAKQKLLELQLPEEVRSHVAMLGQYQWQFVKQAEELRTMAVAKIVKETDHPDARIRLKALDMLGKVTEVALFTERVEIKKTDLSDEELEKRIKEKLGRYMGKADIVDVDAIDLDKEIPGPDEEEK
jgi:hypothetical protein